MRRFFLLAVVLFAIQPVAFATYSVIAVDQKTRQVAFGLATLTSAPANIAPNPTAVIVPGKGVATCQAGVDLTVRFGSFLTKSKKAQTQSSLRQSAPARSGRGATPVRNCRSSRAQCRIRWQRQ